MSMSVSGEVKFIFDVEFNAFNCYFKSSSYLVMLSELKLDVVILKAEVTSDDFYSSSFSSLISLISLLLFYLKGEYFL